MYDDRRYTTPWHSAPRRTPTCRSLLVRGLRVAIVDDDEALCFALVNLARSVGCQADPFLSAETLLMSDDLFLFDCVVADVRLPGIGGLDLVLRLQDRGCRTPVILMTALTDTQLHEQAISVGARCLLRKPVETQALLDWIERSVSNERPLH